MKMEELIDTLSKPVLKCNCTACSTPSDRANDVDKSSGFGWQSSKCCMKQRFGFIFNSKRYSDITFVVGQEPNVRKVPAHKVVLTVGSEVFEVMFSENWASEDNEIELPDTDPVAFLALLRYLYTDEIFVTTEIVVSVLNLARNYNIPVLESGCTKFFMNNIKPNNAFALLNQAIQFKEDQLLNACMEVIDDNTLEAVSADDFCNLHVRVLCLILRRDTLRIGEIELLQAIVRWAKAECRRRNISDTLENHRVVLEGPLSLIRFPTMSAEDFALKVALLGLLSEKQTVSLFLYFQGIPDSSFNFITTPRTGPRTQSAIGQSSSDYSNAASMINSIDIKNISFRPPRKEIVEPKILKSSSRRTRREKLPEELVVKRFSTVKNKWAYMGGADEIGFSSNRDAQLKGIRLYGSKKAGEKYQVTAMVLEPKTGRTLCNTCDIYRSNGFDETYEVLFQNPVSIVALTNYIITVLIEGTPSLYGCGGSKNVAASLKNSGTLIVSFFEVEDKKRGGCRRTDVETGQIPELCFKV